MKERFFYSIAKFTESVRRSASWSSLRRMGESRIVKTSYWWLVVVPIGAKLLSEVPEEIAIPLRDEDVVIAMGLPFTWQLLFAAALCFAIANLCYTVWCPKFVRDYPSYTEFEKDGASSAALVAGFLAKHGVAFHTLKDAWCLGATLSLEPEEGDEASKRFTERWHDVRMTIEEWERKVEPMQVPSKGGGPQQTGGHSSAAVPAQTRMDGLIEQVDCFLHGSLVVPNPAKGEAYSFVRCQLDEQHTCVRVLMALMLLVGFALLGWIFLQNCCYVFSG